MFPYTKNIYAHKINAKLHVYFNILSTIFKKNHFFDERIKIVDERSRSTKRRLCVMAISTNVYEGLCSSFHVLTKLSAKLLPTLRQSAR